MIVQGAINLPSKAALKVVWQIFLIMSIGELLIEWRMAHAFCFELRLNTASARERYLTESVQEIYYFSAMEDIGIYVYINYKSNVQKYELTDSFAHKKALIPESKYCASDLEEIFCNASHLWSNLAKMPWKSFAQQFFIFRNFQARFDMCSEVKSEILSILA